MDTFQSQHPPSFLITPPLGVPISWISTIFALLISAAGFIMTSRDSAARRLCALWIAIPLCYAAATWLYPSLYLPSRFLRRPLPLLGLIFFAVGVSEVSRWFWGRHWRSDAVTLCIYSLFLFTFGARAPTEALNIYDDTPGGLLEFVGSLPRDSVIAGWPEDPVLELIPYFAERSTLVRYETHQAFHRGYVLEMRDRTMAVINSIYALDVSPLAHLRRKYGVSHLLVNRSLYGPEPPSYFEPFNQRIREVHYARDPSWLESFVRERDAIIYETDDYFLVAMSALLD